jgi:hypothetical protein
MECSPTAGSDNSMPPKPAIAIPLGAFSNSHGLSTPHASLTLTLTHL